MQRTLVGGVALLLSAVSAGPASASSVGLPEALQTVTAACDSSRAALAAGGGSIVSPSSVKFFEAGRFEVDSGTVQQVV
nr:hypothetical protein [Candidatus Nanopelagicales bacterium]